METRDLIGSMQIGVILAVALSVFSCQNTSSHAQSLPQLEISKRIDDAIFILSRDSRPLEVTEILVNRRCKVPIDGMQPRDKSMNPVVLHFAKVVVTSHASSQCSREPIIEVTVTTDKGKVTVQY